MTFQRYPIAYLSGAGGGLPDIEAYRVDEADLIRMEAIRYPGWQTYIDPHFSPTLLITELAEKIEEVVPDGPIYLIGMSIGGHFGYAVALELETRGREIGGFCAVDSFMISSDDASCGWLGRALAEVAHLIRKGRFQEFLKLLRSKLWRALLRATRGMLPYLLRKVGRNRKLADLSSFDSVFEQELSMRMLIRLTAPWITNLDSNPVALTAPSILLRTALTVVDDAAWRRRCPNIEIYELTGGHQTLFEPENIDSFRRTYIAATPNWPREQGRSEHVVPCPLHRVTKDDARRA